MGVRKTVAGLASLASRGIDWLTQPRMLSQAAIWAIQDTAYQGMLSVMRLMDSTSLSAAREAYGAYSNREEPSKPYEMDGDVAVIAATGPLMKGGGFWCWLFGGTSYESIQYACEFAEQDEDVTGARIVFDTPGGTLAGCEDTAKSIRALRDAKPVEAYISDCCCSAGYWLAAQCTRITANGRTADIGNIGVYSYMDDLTQMFSEAGVDRHVYRSTPLKGAGIPGSKITKAMDAEQQATTDSAHEEFVRAVAAGRGVSMAKARSWANAHCYTGVEALAEGLIDALDERSVVMAPDDADDPDNDNDDDSEPDGDEAGTDPTDGDEPLAARSAAPNTSSPDLHQGAASAAPATAPSSVPAVPKPTNATTVPVDHVSTTTSAGGGRKQMNLKETVIKALNRVGLTTMAVNVVSVNDENSHEEIATTLAHSVAKEVEAQVGKHPMVVACQAAGLHSPSDLARKLEMADLGAEALNDLREDAKAQAVRAFGEAEGPKISAMVNSMPFPQVKTMRDSWTALADKTFGIGANGEAASRTSAPAHNAEALVATGATESAAKTNWDKLSAEQKAIGKRLGMDVDGKRETWAGQVLKDMGMETVAA